MTTVALTPEQTNVLTLARKLLIVDARCDYASSDDHVGFSRYDADFAKDICKRLKQDGFYPSAKQFAFIRKLVLKYRNQIIRETMDLETWKSKAAAERAFKASVDAVVYAEPPVKVRRFVAFKALDANWTLVHETERAMLVRVRGIERWFPKAVLRDYPEGVSAPIDMVADKFPGIALPAQN